MGGLDVSRLSSASARVGPDPNRGGNNRLTARTSSRLDRRPASCRAGSRSWSAAGHGLDRRALWN